MGAALDWAELVGGPLGTQLLREPVASGIDDKVPNRNPMPDSLSGVITSTEVAENGKATTVGAVEDTLSAVIPSGQIFEKLLLAVLCCLQVIFGY